MARGIIFGGKTDEGSSCQKGSERERKCHCSNIARYNLVQGDFWVNHDQVFSCGSSNPLENMGHMFAP
jgi:hypothetical protein